MWASSTARALQATRFVTRMSQHWPSPSSSALLNAAFHTTPDTPHTVSLSHADAAPSTQTTAAAAARQSKVFAAPWVEPLKRALNHGGARRLRLPQRLFVTFWAGTGRKTHARSEARRKHVQIATVEPDTGRPTVRTVVFRGFLPQKYAAAPSRNENL
jgi:hypothetical protein